MIPKLLRQYNLDLSKIDVIEINEAFASMAVYCRDQLKLEWSKMNPRGTCSEFMVLLQISMRR